MAYNLIENTTVGKAYSNEDGLIAILSVGNGKHHFSLTHEDRTPTLKELKDARYELISDEVTMALLFPPKSYFIDLESLHENSLHMMEIRE